MAQASRALLRAFLLAQTAKDVSLIISLHACSCGACSGTGSAGGFECGGPELQITTRPWGTVALPRDRGVIVYSVAVVDMDPRSVRRVPHYAAQDADISRAWAERTNGGTSRSCQ